MNEYLMNALSDLALSVLITFFVCLSGSLSRKISFKKVGTEEV